MEKINLLKASQELLNTLELMEMERIDKIELMINIYHFLEPSKYEENIRLLKQNQADTRFKKTEQEETLEPDEYGNIVL